MLCRMGSMKDLGYPLGSRWYLRDFFVALNVGCMCVRT